MRAATQTCKDAPRPRPRTHTRYLGERVGLTPRVARGHHAPGHGHLALHLERLPPARTALRPARRQQMQQQRRQTGGWGGVGAEGRTMVCATVSGFVRARGKGLL